MMIPQDRCDAINVPAPADGEKIPVGLFSFTTVAMRNAVPHLFTLNGFFIQTGTASPAAFPALLRHLSTFMDFSQYVLFLIETGRISPYNQTGEERFALS
jgi:hypothetical protein